MIKIIELKESFQQVLTEAQIDPEHNFIRNVCLLTPTSVNGNYYSPEVMEKAIPLFEGSKVFANHPKRSERGEVRDVRDIIGKNINVRMENNKLKADLLVLESHKELVFPLAVQTPDLVGFSINANGKVFRKNRINDIKEIVEVRSVDLVSEPAATLSLFEEKEKKEEKDMLKDMFDWGKITLEELKEQRGDLVEQVEKSALKRASEDGELKELQEENKKLKAQIDEFEVKEALAEKREIRDKLLAESKLPKEAISDSFKEQLLDVEERKIDGKTVTVEEGMKILIKDRETVALSESGKITGMGDEKKLKESKDDITDEQIVEAVKGPQDSLMIN